MVSGANGPTGLSAFYLLMNRGLEKGTDTEPVPNQNTGDLDVLEKALKWKSAKCDHSYCYNLIYVINWT